MHHPTLPPHEAPLIGLPKNSIRNGVSPSNINPYSGTNAGSGSNAVVNMLGLSTVTQDVYINSGDLWQQYLDQPPVSQKNMQAHVVCESFSGANGTPDLMTPGASDDHMSGDNRTMTISWQCIAGTRAQAQVVVTDEIRDPYVHMKHLPIEDFVYVCTE